MPILVYHRVVPRPPREDPFSLFVSTGTFERQLRWLTRSGVSSLSLDDVDAVLRGERSVPPRSVVITFDDGYLDNHAHAWPLLVRYRMRATFFVVSDAIGRDSGFDREGPQPRCAMLDRAHIVEMHRSGMAFGSHTCSHPRDLVALPPRQLGDELSRSRETLEDVIGASVHHFAYPYFRHDARLRAAVAGAGYRTACAGPTQGLARYALGRIIAPDRGGLHLEYVMRRRQLREALRRCCQLTETPGETHP